MLINNRIAAFLFFCILAFLFNFGPIMAGKVMEPPPHPKKTDLLAVALGFELVEKYGQSVWPGFSVDDAPVLLLDENFSYYLNQAQAGEEFQQLEVEFRGNPVFVKERTLPAGLQASFPYLGKDSVVMGTPANTGQKLEAWTLTFVHELFHVYQGRLGFHQQVSGLQIGPDSDGSWQLSYPFPYQEQDITDALHLLGYSLFQTLEKESDPKYEARLAIQALNNLQRICTQRESGVKDFAYLNFQISKEGVARYVEFKMAERLSGENAELHFKNGAPGDYQALWTEKYQTMKFLIKHTGSVSRNRLEFYHLGLGICLLLDRIDSNWKQNFYKERHFLADQMNSLRPKLEGNPACPN